MATETQLELRKRIEADDKLYKKFTDLNVHVESFLAASEKDRKEYGDEINDAFKKWVAADKKKREDEEKKTAEEIAAEVEEQNG